MILNVLHNLCFRPCRLGQNRLHWMIFRVPHDRGTVHDILGAVPGWAIFRGQFGIDPARTANPVAVSHVSPVSCHVNPYHMCRTVAETCLHHTTAGEYIVPHLLHCLADDFADRVARIVPIHKYDSRESLRHPVAYIFEGHDLIRSLLIYTVAQLEAIRTRMSLGALAIYIWQSVLRT